MLRCWKDPYWTARPAFYRRCRLWEIKMEATGALINNRGNFMGHPGSVNKDGGWIIRDVILLMPAALSKTLLVNLIITQSAAELRLHMLPAAQKMLTYFHSWQLHFLSFCRFQNVTQYYAEVQNCSRVQNILVARMHTHTGTHTMCISAKLHTAFALCIQRARIQQCAAMH